MPKQAFPAAAEGMPRINRRAILGGIAAAPALVVPAAANDVTEGELDRVARLAEEMSRALVAVGGDQFKAMVWPATHPQFPGRLELHSATAAENPALVQLGAETAAIEAEYVEAAASERAILAEWQPRWPDAPKEIRRGWGYRGALERDIKGAAIRRRDEHGQEYTMQISTATELQRWVQQIEAEIPHANSPRSRKGSNQALEDFRRQRDIAVAYEGKCARIRRESGYEAARERRQAAERRLAENISMVLQEGAQTLAGVIIQARALNAARHLPFLSRTALELESGVDWGTALAASIIRIGKGGLVA